MEETTLPCAHIENKQELLRLCSSQDGENKGRHSHLKATLAVRSVDFLTFPIFSYSVPRVFCNERPSGTAQTYTSQGDSSPRSGCGRSDSHQGIALLAVSAIGYWDREHPSSGILLKYQIEPSFCRSCHGSWSK